MLSRWTRRRPFRSKELREDSDRRRSLTVFHESRPPLHPSSRRSWSFEQDDPAPMIDTVPTAKSFKSDDSTIQIPTIKPGHSRYSVEDDDEDDDFEDEKTEMENKQPNVVVKKKEIVGDKDDKYLGGGNRVNLWSDDSDSMYARWRSLSGDATSPAMKGATNRSVRSPMGQLSPRQNFRKEPSRKSSGSTTLPRGARSTNTRGRRASQETDARDPPAQVDSTDSSQRKQVQAAASEGSKSSTSKSKSTVSRSKSSSQSSSSGPSINKRRTRRPEQATKPAEQAKKLAERSVKPDDSQPKERNRQGRRNENNQQVGNTKEPVRGKKKENNLQVGSSKASFYSAKKTEAHEQSGEIAEREKKSKTTKYSKRSESSNTSSQASGPLALQETNRPDGRSLHQETYHNESRTSRILRGKQASEASKKQKQVNSISRNSVHLDEEEESEKMEEQRSNTKKQDDSAPCIFDNLTSFNESEKPKRNERAQGKRSTEQMSRYAAAERSPPRYAPEERSPARYAHEARNPAQDINNSQNMRATYVENLSYEPIPILRQESEDNYAASLIQREILILKSKEEVTAKERDPPARIGPREKHYNSHTGTLWNADDASSLTGSFPLHQVVNHGRDNASYAAFLAKADEVAALQQEENESKPAGSGTPVVADRVEAPATLAPEPVQRVRSRVIFPPAMKGFDTSSSEDDLIESNDKETRADPVVSQRLANREELENLAEDIPLATGKEMVKPIESKFKRSIFELCQPATCHLFDGFLAIRSTDKGACDEPFTFLDCKAFDFNASKSKAASANNAAVDSTPQLLEAKSMKLDEEIPVYFKGIPSTANGPLKTPDGVPIFPNFHDSNLPFSVIAIPASKSFTIDDDSYTRSILGLEKLPLDHPLRSAASSPRAQKSKHHDGHHFKKKKPHKRSHSKDVRRSRSKSEEITNRPRRKSSERVRFASPEPSRDRKNNKKKKGFFGKMFRKR